MSDEYWFCVRHHTVEHGDEMCPAIDRLGPYASRAEAEQALDKAEARNREWDAEDEEWESDR